MIPPTETIILFFLARFLRLFVSRCAGDDPGSLGSSLPGTRTSTDPVSVSWHFARDACHLLVPPLEVPQQIGNFLLQRANVDGLFHCPETTLKTLHAELHLTWAVRLENDEANLMCGVDVDTLDDRLATHKKWCSMRECYRMGRQNCAQHNMTIKTEASASVRTTGARCKRPAIQDT